MYVMYNYVFFQLSLFIRRQYLQVKASFDYGVFYQRAMLNF